MNTKLVLLVTVLILSLTRSSLAEDVIKIGWIGPLTGPAAALGIDSVPAIEIVFEKVNQTGGINGKKIKLITEDDQYQTAKTVTAFKNLTEQVKLDTIVMITYGGLFAVSERAEKNNVLLIDPLDCDDQIAALPSNTVCIAKKTEELGFINADYAVSKNLLPAALIYFEGDPFMGVVAESSIKRIKEKGGTVAYSEGYTSGTTDFRSQLVRIRNTNAKSIFFYGYDEMGLAMKQARDLGLKQQFFAMNTITSPGFKESAGKAAEGSFAGSWYAPRGKAFENFLLAFQKKVGRLPLLEISTVPSFDIANIIVETLKNNLDSKPVHQVVKERLYGLTDYQGASGSISVDKDGIVRSLVNKMYVFHDGQLEEAPE